MQLSVTFACEMRFEVPAVLLICLLSSCNASTPRFEADASASVARMQAMMNSAHQHATQVKSLAARQATHQQQKTAGNDLDATQEYRHGSKIPSVKVSAITSQLMTGEFTKG